jgi:2-aminoadipate transaminase
MLYSYAMTTTPWKLSARAAKMNPSILRELLKLTDQPNIISLAGGLPSPKTFPVEQFAKACAKVLQDDQPQNSTARASLQYAASEGFTPLREWVAQSLPWKVAPEQVLITTGSQQGLDLVGKILIDTGSKVLVETPTYLGALQAFAPMEPDCVSLASDEHGLVPADLAAKAHDARFLYLLPNFQNPSGKTLSEERRAEISRIAANANLPLIEDNPYGDLWFDAPPPLPLTARNPEGCIYLGSFSKTLAPGLRLGFAVAPKNVYPKMLQAKQAADLHTPIFNQRIAYEVLTSGVMDQHVKSIRQLYKAQRDAMLAALTREMPKGVRWSTPVGGMFLWLEVPEHICTTALLPVAVKHNVAFVPGAAFYTGGGPQNTMRLSFVTASQEQIATAIAALARAMRELGGV